MTTSLFRFIEAELYRFLSSIMAFRPAMLDWAVRAGFNVFAAELFDGKFDHPAPPGERKMKDDMFMRKWAFPVAARFLMNCDTMTATSVLTRLFEEKNLRADHKPRVIMELWLTLPMFGNDREKAIDIFRGIINPDLIADILGKSTTEAALMILEKVREKKIYNALQKLEPDSVVYLLHCIREKDAASCQSIMWKFPPDFAMRIQERLRQFDHYYYVSPHPYGAEPERKSDDSEDENLNPAISPKKNNSQIEETDRK